MSTNRRLTRLHAEHHAIIAQIHDRPRPISAHSMHLVRRMRVLGNQINRLHAR